MAAIKDYESSNVEVFPPWWTRSVSPHRTQALDNLILKFDKNKGVFEFCIISARNAAHSSMEHAEYTFAMPYEFLHHLSYAPLPVRIYDSVLIKKAHGHQSHGILIAEHNNNHQSTNGSIALLR